MPDSTVPITAQVLTWAREEAGLTQVELAKRAKVAYHGSPDLRELWHDMRASRPPRSEDDPYETVAQQLGWTFSTAEH